MDTRLMDKEEIVAARRKRLREWIENNHGSVGDGGLELFRNSQTTPINQGELSGLLRGKSFGETKALNIEQATPGMPQGYLLHPLDDVKPRKVDSSAQAANHVLALQYTIRSLVHALTVNTPAAAGVFVDHLRAQVKAAGFAEDGLVGEALGIAEPIRRTSEDAIQHQLRLASGGRAKSKK